MTAPQALRQVSNRLLEALRQALAAEARGGMVGMDAVDAVLDHFMLSPDYLPFFENAALELSPAVPPPCRRRDALGRLVVHPLKGVFDAGLFGRDILPNLFSFFHLILGDELAGYQAECQALVEQLKAAAPSADRWDWSGYYRAEPALQIYWRILIHIAALFNKRWDVRKDWFLKLMQYNPTTSSLGSMAFQVNSPTTPTSAPPNQFGDAAFKLLFRALYDPFARLPSLDLAAFRQQFGAGAL